MRALIAVAHHHPRFLTHAFAAHIAEGVVHTGHSAEIADLASEDFKPRFSLVDHVVYRGQASPPADVLAEQARIDRADTLVLIYPTYWWSMSAPLKGWIDRVFSNDWTFDYSIGGDLRKKLQRLRVTLVGVGGTGVGAFEWHGYAGTMRTQIDHGIFNYCGARVACSEPLLGSGSADLAAYLEQARQIGAELFTSIRRPVSA